MPRSIVRATSKRTRGLLAVAFVALGCTEATGATDLADAIAPHEAEIVRFERWAQRTTHASGARERERRDETLFSTVRSDPRFVTVVVERGGRSPWRAVHPTDAEVPELAWQAIRTTQLGILEAARDPEDATHVWARHADASADGLTLTFELGPLDTPSTAGR